MSASHLHPQLSRTHYYLQLMLWVRVGVRGDSHIKSFPFKVGMINDYFMPELLVKILRVTGGTDY